MNEPKIIINGIELTEGQAMTLRVALTLCLFDCGDDERGLALHKNYGDRAFEIMKIMQNDKGD